MNTAAQTMTVTVVDRQARVSVMGDAGVVRVVRNIGPGQRSIDAVTEAISDAWYRVTGIHKIQSIRWTDDLTVTVR